VYKNILKMIKQRNQLRQVLFYISNTHLYTLVHMLRSNLRTPWPIHFKFHRVIGIDGLTVCILYGEISNFHSRVVGLYSSNCTIENNIFCQLRLSIPITVRSLKWIGEGVFNLQCDIRKIAYNLMNKVP
jgi:hypothetical protein